MGKFNDLDLENWREVDVNTDSLWLIGERARTGKHKNVYHGDFIPQIRQQTRIMFDSIYGEKHLYLG